LILFDSTIFTSYLQDGKFLCYVAFISKNNLLYWIIMISKKTLLANLGLVLSFLLGECHISQNQNNDVAISNKAIKKEYLISEVLSLFKTGLLTCEFINSYNINPSNIVKVIPEQQPIIYLNQDGFDKISSINDQKIHSIKNLDALSISFFDPDYTINELSSSSIMNKFPYFKEVLSNDSYSSLNNRVEDYLLVARCYNAHLSETIWKEATAMTYFVSLLQSLQRLLASVMIKPLAINYAGGFKGGLSTEYTCEIYAQHRYGAKLLDFWHYYLIGPNPEQRHPDGFWQWLQNLTSDDLKTVGVTKLEEIPQIHYIADEKERSKWQLRFFPNNGVVGPSIGDPKQEGEKIELVYVLGMVKDGDEESSQFIGGIKVRGTIGHSSFFSGEKVLGTGRMILTAVKDGSDKLVWILTYISDESGHYKPNDCQSLLVLQRLKEFQVDLNKVKWSSRWGVIHTKNEVAEVAYKRLSENILIL
jgi:hypothetical protein